MKKLDAARELFALERDDMMIIIRHYQWNQEKMENNWFENKEELQYRLGLVYDS